MKFNILTLFPDMFKGVLEESIIGRAEKKGILSFNYVNIRDFTNDKHGRVDDYAYGGGTGLVMAVQPIYDAWKSVCGEKKKFSSDFPVKRFAGAVLFRRPEDDGRSITS